MPASFNIVSYSAHPRLLYLASSNAGKLREYRGAAAPFGVSVELIPDFDKLVPCIEDGSTFAENACKKALHYSRVVHGTLFSDDSGICVDALGGAPGVHSARYAGPGASDAENNQKLVQALAGVGPVHRTACYLCVIALAREGTLLGTFEGRAEGLILDAPRGLGGFGYDPYFLFLPLGKTFAEISADDKFAVSHRGTAFRHLLKSLPSLSAIG